jgi:hypothetical protein
MKQVLQMPSGTKGESSDEHPVQIREEYLSGGFWEGQGYGWFCGS